MAGILRFEDIEAWKTARELTRLIYALAAKGAFARDFGLRDQIQRASVSIMSNIAEGFDSRTDIQFINYLGHSRASAAETRSQLYIALDLHYISTDEFEAATELTDKVSRQISRFISYLEAHPHSVREEPAIYDSDV